MPGNRPRHAPHETAFANGAKLWPIVLAAAVAFTGCVMSDPSSDSPGAEARDDGSASSGVQYASCAYQETLLVIDAADARRLVPADYTPVNGFTGDANTAILFVPFLGCDTAWVHVGVTVEAPSDAPGRADVNGYLLGSFVDGAATDLQALLAGPTARADIAQTTTGPTSALTVAGALTMTAAHSGRNDVVSAAPFSIRLFHDDANGRSTVLLTVDDLERENSAGTFESDALFGHAVPPGTPIGFVGTATGLKAERLE